MEGEVPRVLQKEEVRLLRKREGLLVPHALSVGCSRDKAGDLDSLEGPVQSERPLLPSPPPTSAPTSPPVSTVLLHSTII